MPGDTAHRINAKLEKTAHDNNASVFITGVDPGFANDLIPFVFAGTCQRIEQIRCMEIADYATYDGAEVMFDVMGFGKQLDETPMLFLPGILGLAWGTTMQILAAGLGITIDEVVAVAREEAVVPFAAEQSVVTLAGVDQIRPPPASIRLVAVD